MRIMPKQSMSLPSMEKSKSCPILDSTVTSFTHIPEPFPSSSDLLSNLNSTHLKRKQWRKLMKLHLPIEDSLSEDYKKSHLKVDVKPGTLTFEELMHYERRPDQLFLAYNAVISSPNPDSSSPDLPSPPAVITQQPPLPKKSNIKQPNQTKSAPLPMVTITEEGAKDPAKVFDPNPSMKKPKPVAKKRMSSLRKISSALKITNKELLDYMQHSVWTRMKNFCCCKNKKSPLDFDTFVMGPRSRNSVAYISSNLNTLLVRRIPQGRIEARNSMISAYQRTLDTLLHLSRVKDLVEKATDSLSYSKYYLDRPLNNEELKLIENRSIIGSLIWVSTYCIQFLNGKDVPDNIKSDVKLRIEDVVGSSVLLWSAAVHMVETTKSCANILEHAIVKFVFTLRAPEEERRDSADLTTQVNPDKLDRVKRRRWKIKHALEIRAAQAEMYYWQGKNVVLRPALNVFTKLKEGKEQNQGWMDLKKLPISEAVGVILRSSSKVLSIFEDEVTQLTNLDRSVQSIVKTTENVKKTKNFLEATLCLERVLQSLHQFPNNLLKHSEVDELKEVGRIILDRVDELLLSLEGLIAIAFEATHIVHICYEYIRVYYKWPLQNYDAFAPINHKRYMSYWAHNDDFKVAKPPESIKEPILFFHDSVYQKILRTVILNVPDRDICIGKLDETQPFKAIAVRESMMNKARLEDDNKSKVGQRVSIDKKKTLVKIAEPPIVGQG